MAKYFHLAILCTHAETSRHVATYFEALSYPIGAECKRMLVHVDCKASDAVHAIRVQVDGMWHGFSGADPRLTTASALEDADRWFSHALRLAPSFSAAFFGDEASDSLSVRDPCGAFLESRTVADVLRVQWNFQHVPEGLIVDETSFA